MYAREKERQCARERNLKASYKKKKIFIFKETKSELRISSETI